MCGEGDLMGNRAGPAPRGRAWWAVARCLGTSCVMLAHHRVHLPRERVGRMLHFADGSTSRVFRETTVDGPRGDPCVLVVAFRLRRVRGVAHRIFEAESLLNTPLFVGFPGFVSKLWCAHDSLGVYRGLYEWDGAGAAQYYAASLWRVLELVSVPNSIRYRVLPGLRRDEVLNEPSLLLVAPGEPTRDGWWRLVGMS
jgi:hypothetical protein